MIELFVKWLEGWRDTKHKRANEKTKKKIVESSKSVFNVYEDRGELWLIYNDYLICPMSMFKDDTIVALKKIRDLYVDDMVNKLS